MSPKTVALVPAAGYGKRLGLKAKKPFVLLRGSPLVVHTLRALESSKSIDHIILAAEKSCVGKIRRIIDRYAFRKVGRVVIGGKTRFESVRKCLEAADPSFDMVLVHDGARPFIARSLIDRSIRLAQKYGACIVAVPENDTVKLADREGFIVKTLDRSILFRAQTPQVFRRRIIEKAYRYKGKRRITDDASLAEAIGARVKILNGSCRNIKITTKEDLKMAEALL